MLMSPLPGRRKAPPRRDSVAMQDEGAGFMAFLGEHQQFMTETKAG